MAFSIGVVSLVAALFGVIVIYGNFWVRSFIAWYMNTEPPKDRVRFGAFAVGIICFFAGSFVQPQYDKLVPCTNAGYTWGQCLTTFNH